MTDACSSRRWRIRWCGCGAATTLNEWSLRDGVLVLVAGLTAQVIAGPWFRVAVAADVGDEGRVVEWTDISKPVLERLARDGAKIAWPGGTAGVAVDPKSGDVFMETRLPEYRGAS